MTFWKQWIPYFFELPHNLIITPQMILLMCITCSWRAGDSLYTGCSMNVCANGCILTSLKILSVASQRESSVKYRQFNLLEVKLRGWTDLRTWYLMEHCCEGSHCSGPGGHRPKRSPLALSHCGTFGHQFAFRHLKNWKEFWTSVLWV